MVQEQFVSIKAKRTLLSPAITACDSHQQEEVRRRQVGLQLPRVQVRQENRQISHLQSQPEHRVRTSIKVETERRCFVVRKRLIY